jgi:hypothetical protein
VSADRLRGRLDLPPRARRSRNDDLVDRARRRGGACSPWRLQPKGGGAAEARLWPAPIAGDRHRKRSSWPLPSAPLGFSTGQRGSGGRPASAWAFLFLLATGFVTPRTPGDNRAESDGAARDRLAGLLGDAASKRLMLRGLSSVGRKGTTNIVGSPEAARLIPKYVSLVTSARLD